jgi:hypothetical protein
LVLPLTDRLFTIAFIFTEVNYRSMLEAEPTFVFWVPIAVIVLLLLEGQEDD